MKPTSQSKNISEHYVHKENAVNNVEDIANEFYSFSQCF